MDIYYRWLALGYRGSLAGGPAISIPCGRDTFGMPFGLQMLGPVRGDEGLLAVAKNFEMLFEMAPETARPRPDLVNIASSQIDLRSIVTHPPIVNKAGRSAKPSMRTAV